ncbi:hypothetical protein BT96DRAFT_987286 [Gymnopus androsaceus JB14]|uniref:C2H2-type domain-containing protein n=1 Tax=Gymnopus androsaceus JB14 TaxID=1447944 RepID=A0A6A4ICB1_9AGAR|nr:hypothetical protein BT96DRAFT_987286 [Gymnopus androsaceus JB14]
MSQEYFIPASPANDEEIHAYYHARIEQPMNNYHYPTNHMQSPTTTSDPYAATLFNNNTMQQPSHFPQQVYPTINTNLPNSSQYEQAQLWSPGYTAIASSPYSPTSHSSASIPSLYAHPPQQRHLTVSTDVFTNPYERPWPSATECTSPPSSAPPETPESAIAQWNTTQQPHLPSGNIPSWSSSPTAPDMKKKTVATSSVQAAADKKRKKVASFRCSFCSASLTAKHNLIHHENSHKGLKQFPSVLGGAQKYDDVQNGEACAEMRFLHDLSVTPTIMPTIVM